MSDFMAEKKIVEAWDNVWNKLYSPDTNVIYDCFYKTYSFPTPEEIAANIPNCCGWNTGMEDGMISAGNMLSIIANRYSVEKDERLHEYAENILKGIYRCAKVSGRLSSWRRIFGDEYLFLCIGSGAKPRI